MKGVGLLTPEVVRCVSPLELLATYHISYHYHMWLRGSVAFAASNPEHSLILEFTTIVHKCLEWSRRI